MNFGDKIQLQRKKKGMTQEELGEELNVSRQTITKWESNQSFPEIKKIIKLSYFFDVTIDYLLKDEIEDEEKNISIKIEKEKKNIFSTKIKLLIIPLFVSAVGMLILYIDSYIHPITITDWDGTYYDGFWGYLYINGRKELFYILLLIFLINCTFILYFKKKDSEDIRRTL
ncbi:helix-turn-helix transcriptional regulator [uncultured Fusobacterium sp.]|uniref:helix-turn-helix domain-containing protein n=1 Tax=uncultured Fusobacterium sp. TaxID=159267 RepID=UPI0025E47270|nr:helix-turn-helix transcriptional regulator [uncultured Fusobacterium sp.]